MAILTSTASAADASGRSGRRRAWRIYVLAVACVAVGAGAWAALVAMGLPDADPYLLMALPVVVVAWFGGLGPGLTATALGVLTIDIAIHSHGLFEARSPQELVTAGMFIALGVLISSLGHLRRHATASFRRIHDDLEDRIADRTGELLATNTALINEASAREAQHEELRALNRRLEESNRELQDFASIASHDLQEPLRKIRAFGDRLGHRYGEQLQGPGRDYLDRMQNAAGRMQVLIEDLLTFSRVTSQARPFVPVDLNQVAAEVVSDLEHRIESLGAVVWVDPLPVIDADAMQMWQLLQNLLGNALKFTRPGEPPRVRLYANWSHLGVDDDAAAGGREDDAPDTPRAPDGAGAPDAPGASLTEAPTGDHGVGFVQLCVSDNGIGLEQRHMERIFHVFQRLHGRQAYEGTGIGLAVCRKIAIRHGGDITVRSRPGEGATFVVTLPVRHAKGGQLDAAQPRQTDHDPAGR